MSGKNITIMALVAAVLIICLVASFVYLSGDDDGSDEVRDPEIGDSYTFLIETTLGPIQYQYHETTYLTGVEGDTAYLARYNSSDWYTVDTAPVDDIFMLGELELLREGVPVTPAMGEEIVCDEYSGDYLGLDSLVYLDADGLPVLRVVTFDMGSFRISLYDTTLRDEAPSYSGVTVDRDIGLGDFMFFYGDLESVDDVPMMMIVQYVSDDGMVTYYNEYLDDEVTCSVDDFLRFGESGDFESVGRHLIESNYGDILCDKYVIPDGDGYRYAYVGVDDGVCHYIEFVDADGDVVGDAELEFASMLVGEYPYEGLREIGVGDFEAYLHTYTDAEGASDHSLRESYATSEIDGVLIVECYENDSLDHIHEGSFNTTPTGDVIGREDLNTIYGVIGCDMLMDVSDGVTTYNWVADDGAVMKRVVVNDDGTSEEFLLIYNTSLESATTFNHCINTGEIEAGTWFTYDHYDANNELIDTHTEVVTAVDGDTATVVIDDTETVERTVTSLLYGFDGYGTSDPVGRTILETWMGTRLCDVYETTVCGYDALVYVGVHDGVHYVTELLDEQGFVDSSLYLYRSSTVF